MTGCRCSQSMGEARQDWRQEGKKEHRLAIRFSAFSLPPSPFDVLLVGLSRLGVSNGPAFDQVTCQV